MSIKTRIKQLEKLRAGPPAFGIQRSAGPVTLCGDDEEMTPEEFYDHYPAGEIIHIILLDGPEDARSE